MLVQIALYSEHELHLRVEYAFDFLKALDDETSIN